MSILITALVSILIFGLVVLIHELGHFVCAKRAGIQVNEFSIGMGPALLKKIYNGTQYSIRLLPIGGYVMMEGEDEELEEKELQSTDWGKAQEPSLQPAGIPYPQAKVWKRMIVVAAGAIMNFVLGFVVLGVVFGFFSGESLGSSRVVAQVEPGSVLEQAGLQVGDEIVAINGHHCFTSGDISYELSRLQDQTASFTVLREGTKIQLEKVTFPVEQQGETQAMDIGFRVQPVAQPPWNVVKQAGSYTVFYARLVARSLWDVLTGYTSVNQLSGPVGIVNTIGQATTMGADQVLSILALITVNLGVFNLLPFPALDGGKLVFLALEGIFRKPIPKKFEIVVNAAGMLCLFGLMLYATFNDILRLF